MTRCIMCKLRKPDSLFSKTNKSTKGKCLNCRAITRGGGRLRPRGGMFSRDFQADEIKPSKGDAKLIAFAKAEMKKFKQRGAPVIERPYAFIAADPAKGIVSRKLFQRH